MKYFENYYEVNGVSLHVIEAGPRRGNAIFFLHGFPEYSGMWESQMRFFAGRGFRVIAVDQRGYNLSDKPKGIKAYTGEELAKDIHDLAEQMNYKKIHVVGHDWGGMVGWYLAILYPRLIKKMVIINAPHPQVFYRTVKSSWQQRLKSWYMLIFQLPWLPEGLLRLGNYRALSNSMKESSASGTFDDAFFEPYKEAWSKEGALTSMINWYRGMRYANKTLLSGKKARVSLLLIWGMQDKFLKPELAQKSVNMCTNGKLQLSATGSHWIVHEQPNEVNKWILEFFRPPSSLQSFDFN